MCLHTDPNFIGIYFILGTKHKSIYSRRTSFGRSPNIPPPPHQNVEHKYCLKNLHHKNWGKKNLSKSEAMTLRYYCIVVIVVKKLYGQYIIIARYFLAHFLRPFEFVY